MNIPVGGDIGEEVHLVDQALTFTQGEQPFNLPLCNGVDSCRRCEDKSTGHALQGNSNSD